MPIVGERQKNIGRSYKGPMSGLASEFKNTISNILTESGVDIFTEPQKVMMVPSASESMRNFFVENSCDPESFEEAADYDDHIEMMNAQYDNNAIALQENASLGQYSPVVGLAFPLHKNILMNCIFDKGAIPKDVAQSPKFTITMENRYLVTPSGEKIDIWRDQSKITDAVEATSPFKEVELTLPEFGVTKLVEKMGGSAIDKLSIETYISAVKIECKTAFKKDEMLPDGTKATAETSEAWFPVNLRFTPSYGEYDRTLMEPIVIRDAHVDETKRMDTISGSLSIEHGTAQIMSLRGCVKGVKLSCRIDTSSAAVQTCGATWDSKTIIEEIGSGYPINVTISPEEVKDVGALYNVNQLSKIMEIFQLILGNTKDDQIRRHLDKSFKTLPEECKIWGMFDFAPREGYLLDQVEWRNKTFMDMLDTHVTKMLQVYNDPNVVVTVFGRPDLIRKLSPTEYTYTAPSNIGPVDLEFSRVVTTSDKRTYQFISSQKLKESNELIIILCPKNTNRIMYKIYDYQMYITNEIRNAANPTLPAIHAFQRWKFVEYQPVQGRLRILNPTGLREGKDIPSLGTAGPMGMQQNFIPVNAKPIKAE